MNAIALGKVTVTTAGTPVPITAAMITAAGGQLPPNGGCCRIEAWAVPGSTGVVFVKTVQGNKVVMALPVPASGFAENWVAEDPEGGNTIYPAAFQLDAASNNDGAYVTVWVS
ncbi:hypothetical protein UFOVP130_30 [uncultured Caudovirales phage]|uniref:Uncharacterized protein n=1 Tax=uncultured Caudovirales phage TaxID=2100421 RepID=A0A6J5LGF2_9CAUD|nr:hypothetical protein UFOVP130_30 [uncultured Caudovirales phage]